jgi:uridine kinase
VPETWELARVIEAVSTAIAPPSVATRLIGIDGHGGSGKSTLAARLQRELDLQVVHTDHFASWDNPLNWWPRLLDQVLVPLATGDEVTFHPTQWGDTKPDPVVVRPRGLIVLEGVSATRSAFSPYLALKIWVETPRELCFQRGLARDGEGAREEWEQWLAAEDQYIARERRKDYADIVFDGITGL